MGLKYINLKGIVTATTVFVTSVLPLGAQQADSRDETQLLAELAQADATRALHDWLTLDDGRSWKTGALSVNRLGWRPMA